MKSEYLCKMGLTFKSTEHRAKNVFRVSKMGEIYLESTFLRAYL